MSQWEGGLLQDAIHKNHSLLSLSFPGLGNERVLHEAGMTTRRNVHWAWPKARQVIIDVTVALAQPLALRSDSVICEIVDWLVKLLLFIF